MRQGLRPPGPGDAALDARLPGGLASQLPPRALRLAASSRAKPVPPRNWARRFPLPRWAARSASQAGQAFEPPPAQPAPASRAPAVRLPATARAQDVRPPGAPLPGPRPAALPAFPPLLFERRSKGTLLFRTLTDQTFSFLTLRRLTSSRASRFKASRSRSGVELGTGVTGTAGPSATGFGGRIFMAASVHQGGRLGVDGADVSTGSSAGRRCRSGRGLTPCRRCRPCPTGCLCQRLLDRAFAAPRSFRSLRRAGGIEPLGNCFPGRLQSSASVLFMTDCQKSDSSIRSDLQL